MDIWIAKIVFRNNLCRFLTKSQVGNTDGVDPDSVVNMLLTDSYISVGDDGVSIKSDNITTAAGTTMMMATRNITMRRLQIRSRNWCIGSSTFGGVYDILFEDSVIGDPKDIVAGQVPWAFKFKSHEFFPGPIENILVRRIEIAAVASTPWMYPSIVGGAFALGLRYAGTPRRRSGTPRARNITFEDIYVHSAGTPGKVQGLPESCFEELTFRNVTFGKLVHSTSWSCSDVEEHSFSHTEVRPPFPKCTNTAPPNGTCGSTHHAAASPDADEAHF